VASRRLALRLRKLLPGGRFESVPGGLRNIVSVARGTRPALVIGAHYDVDAHPPGFVGANDGAAGTAAVVELARALRRRPAGARELRFVLFDGEEEPLGTPDSEFYERALRGSKAYVAAHAREVGDMVLLDYIANRGLQLPREGSSDPVLWVQLRAAARRVGAISYFPDGEEIAIFDDHTPFLRAGIPAIDLIDWSYRYRDTVEDTVDKLSVRSLDAVGESVAQLAATLP
jgi:Zn-dependent M28 family amino/carboxypeptidase